MSRSTSALRLDELTAEQPGITIPANSPFDDFQSAHQLLAEMARLTDEELACLEDELNFYAFTGMAGPCLKKLLPLVDPRHGTAPFAK